MWLGVLPADPYLLRVVEAGDEDLVARSRLHTRQRLSVVCGENPLPQPAWHHPALGYGVSRMWLGVLPADPYLLRVVEAGDEDLVARSRLRTRQRLSVVCGGNPLPQPAWHHAALGHGVSRMWQGVLPADPYLLRVVEAGDEHLVARPRLHTRQRVSVVCGGNPLPQPAWHHAALGHGGSRMWQGVLPADPYLPRVVEAGGEDLVARSRLRTRQRLSVVCGENPLPQPACHHAALGHGGSRMWQGVLPADPYLLRVVEAGDEHLVARSRLRT